MIKRIALLTLLVTPLWLSAQVRTEKLLEKRWKFTREDNPEFKTSQFDDTKWQSVCIPHDWAIYGPFSINNDKQNTAIVQDGQKEAMEHAGRTGGLPFVGTGWYRLRFDVPEYTDGKKCTLVFDGAMSHARVYINGKEAGYWPNGYNAFSVDASPFLKQGESNTLAVRLENFTESSRWYPGAGLYRNVHLIVTDDAHVPVWGTQIITTALTDKYAKVKQATSWNYPSGKSLSDYVIVTDLVDHNGKIVATNRKQGSDFDNDLFEQEFVIENPAAWTPETPDLYTSISKIYEGDVLKDQYSTTFGIRTVEVRQGEGFFLNGKRVQFKGVCNHHDLGPLGGIANEAGIRRQIRMLKDMGCNAIRTSHNMPAPELIKACDEMGMMVMAESFDEWATAKVQNGYHTVFGEWAEKDIVNLVRHFRNNPSVVMWCIGNEVPDQWAGDKGPKLSLWLQNICHREDPTRPVTQGMDAPDAVVNNNMAAVMDVPGFNYRPFKYIENYKKLPQEIILGSETASTISSRGVYKFPVVRRSMPKYPDHQSSSYDVEHCGWSNLPEDDFIQHEDLPYCIGEFVWTGFDYLGEPTPYNKDLTNLLNFSDPNELEKARKELEELGKIKTPSRSSYFGIVDLCGFPKDRYYNYKSYWRPDVPTVHILPHWNWQERIGEITPVHIYTSGDAVELFLNGKSLGRREKVHSYDRLTWDDVRYEPGSLRAIAYKNGQKWAEELVETTGKPAALQVTAEKTELKNDGTDLSFIRVAVVDSQGRVVPRSKNHLKFSVTGPAEIIATDNGDATSLLPFQLSERDAYNGLALVILRSQYMKQGKVVLTVESKGLPKQKVVLKVE